MTDRNYGNLPTECKDQDDILPIRKKAWKLREPLPSTSENQLTTNFDSNFSTRREPSSQQKTEGYPFQFQNTSPVQPVQNQLGNNLSSIHSISSPAQSTLPYEQNQNTHLGHAQHEGCFPVMAPIIWYYPCCHQCQHFANQYFQ